MIRDVAPSDFLTLIFAFRSQYLGSLSPAESTCQYRKYGKRPLSALCSVAALTGLVSFLSPYVLPLIPAYLGYLSGTTLNDGVAKTVE